MQCFVLTKHIGSVMSSIRSPLLQEKKEEFLLFQVQLERVGEGPGGNS